MKKIIGLFILTLLLSGCTKEITCKTTNSDNNIDINYNIKYQENKIDNITLTKTYKFNTKEELENYNSIMTYTVKKDTTKNINVSYKQKNKKYILTYKYNIKNMSEEEMTETGLKNNKDELINYLSKNGLICK